MANGQKTKDKNILLLIADDLGKNLGCYGVKDISTPNIDALAANGILFSHAFTSTASCSASRSVIYTGLHTHQNGQYGLCGERHHFTTFDKVDTAPLLFSRLGYLTGVIGKVHVGPDSVYPWDVREPSWTRDVSWVADRAGAFFEKSKSSSADGGPQPFFLTVGYIDPHRDRSRSGFGNHEGFDARVKDIKYSPFDVAIPTFINDLDESRFEFAEYYQSISRLDQGIGMILSELEKAGQAENTLVIFLSDNGPPFINSKTTLFDAGVCLPMIIRQPGYSTGFTNPNMISYVDILPTLLEWAGETKHSHLPGNSFLPILRSSHVLEDPTWPQLVFGSHTFHEITNYWPTRFMRTRKYKYHRNIAWRLDFPFSADLYGSLTWEGVRNSAAKKSDSTKDTNISKNEVMVGPRRLKDYIFRPPEELYDLEEDPDEVRDLAKDEKNAELVAGFRERLEQWQRDTNDPWLYRDGISVMFIQKHLDAGMKVPDRWDFDVEDVATR
ncbi:putative n-sulfoglucosamine sulfohydrolase [Phaeomoniella chlamydospora]|uniref:Putative n-sulfoglucosamine sulfohydrolase n=1 Tax=Phaeomoniella chlamydospora TaxID=158046 RepID=A0A0G2G4R5_PHACM|nr:putative n-sulfoglucosamine sulfohydrolase [Phaeomoniella chlamydospora]